MQTIEQYAADLAADDQGRWRAATRRAAELVAPRHPRIDLTRRFPLPQILLQTTALILHGLAGHNGTDPDDVSALAVHHWAAERMLPLPPHPDGPMTDTQWADADRQWRHDRDEAVDRIRRDLAGLLRNAGHAIPDPDIRSLHRYSADPVVQTWIDLADTDPPDSSQRYGILEQFPVPRLALGVTALHDLADHDEEDF